MQCRNDIGDCLIKSRRTAKAGLSVLLAAMLSLFSVALLPRSAGASSDGLSVSDAQQAVNTSKYSLAEAQAKLDSISSECSQLETEIADMQAQVDELAEQTIAAQDAMFKGRESLGKAMQHEYRNSSASAMLGVVFGSSDWSSFTKGVDYIYSIMDSQAAEVENQKRLKAELEDVSGKLTSQKDEQEAKLGELERKRDEAQNVVNQVSEEVAANSEKLEELKAQAAAISASTQDAADVATGSFGDSGGDSGGNSGGDQGGGNSGSGNSSGGGGAWTAPMSSSWNSGYATAYDLIGGTTASGVRYEEGTMGVAIDIHTPGYGKLVKSHRAIAISYGGNTVYAQIVDGGNFARYGNSLDLMRAVYSSLDPGATSARYWGKRTVTYRLL